MGGGGLGVGNAETRKYCRYNDGRSNRARARESRNKAARFIHASPREPPATLIHLARNQPFSPLFFAVPPSTRSGRALADRRIGALSDSARSRAADLCVVTRRPPSYGIATRATLVALYFASTRGRGEGGGAHDSGWKPPGRDNDLWTAGRILAEDLSALRADQFNRRLSPPSISERIIIDGPITGQSGFNWNRRLLEIIFSPLCASTRFIQRAIALPRRCLSPARFAVPLALRGRRRYGAVSRVGWRPPSCGRPSRGKRVRQLLHDRSNFSVTTGKPAAVSTDRHLPREGWLLRPHPSLTLPSQMGWLDKRGG